MVSEWISRRAAADILGVRPETMNAWESEGLLKEMGIAMRDTASGGREHRESDVRRVRSEITVEVHTWVEGGPPLSAAPPPTG